MKARKYTLRVSSILPSDAEGMFDLLCKIHGTHYVGVYKTGESVTIGVHMKNVVEHSRIKKFFVTLGVKIETI